LQLVGKATNLVRQLRDAYYAALDKYDVLVMPTLPFLPAKLPAKEASVAELMVASAGVSLNTSAFNLVRLLACHVTPRAWRLGPSWLQQTGMPALSLPVGFLYPLGVSTGLPVGMQIVGKFYAEPTIYRVAYAWEQNYDWKTFA
jgi:amidase